MRLSSERESLERISQDYVGARYGEQVISGEEASLFNELWREVYTRIREAGEHQKQEDE